VLTALPGPRLSLRFGRLAVADPWWPEMVPVYPVTALGGGEQPIVVTTVGLTRTGEVDPQPVPVAASIGELGMVTDWHPLVQNEAHFHLEVDSALGAFYDISDVQVLQPLFEDAEHMKGVFDRAVTEKVVAMEAQGGVVAVVFGCPDGPGSYPVYEGFGENGQVVAVLVDLGILSGAVRRVE
jgi:hypothetical protein